MYYAVIQIHKASYQCLLCTLSLCQFISTTNPTGMNNMVSGFPLSYQKHHHPLSSSQSQEPLDIICHVPPIFHLLLGQVLSSTMETSPGIAQYCLTAQICHQHITSSLRTICSYRVKCTLLDQHPSLCHIWLSSTSHSRHRSIAAKS